MAQEVGTPRRRERAALASPKRSPRWPCLGGETDGVVPLKAQYQPTTRPTPPSTRPPTLTHMLNYSCAPQNPTKDLLRCRYAGWWWHLVWRLHNYWQGFFPPFMQMWVFWDGLVARYQDVRRHKQLQLNMSELSNVETLQKMLRFHVGLRSHLLRCGTYIIPRNVQTLIHPPGQLRMNRVFLLSLQWATVQIDWKKEERL